MADADQGRGDRRGTVRRALALVLLAILAALAIANADEVKVNWLVATWRTPLVVLIAVSVLAGVVVGWVLGARGARRSG